MAYLASGLRVNWVSATFQWRWTYVQAYGLSGVFVQRAGSSHMLSVGCWFPWQSKDRPSGVVPSLLLLGLVVNSWNRSDVSFSSWLPAAYSPLEVPLLVCPFALSPPASYGKLSSVYSTERSYRTGNLVRDSGVHATMLCDSCCCRYL